MRLSALLSSSLNGARFHSPERSKPIQKREANSLPYGVQQIAK